MCRVIFNMRHASYITVPFPDKHVTAMLSTKNNKWPLTGSNHPLNANVGHINFLGEISDSLVGVLVRVRMDVRPAAWQVDCDGGGVEKKIESCQGKGKGEGKKEKEAHSNICCQ